MEVKVNPKPIVDLGADLFICEGEVLELKAPENCIAQWIPGGHQQSIELYEEGNYKLIATNEFGCIGEDEIKIGILDDYNLSIGDLTTNEGSVLLNVDTECLNYEWENHDESQFFKKDGWMDPNYINMLTCRGNGLVEVYVDNHARINMGDKISICEGTSVMLDAGHWERYLWSTGETDRTIRVNKSSTYNVKVWDSNNSEVSDVIEVEILPTPRLEIIADTLNMYLGQAGILDAGPGFSSYEWSTGSTNNSIEILEKGEYTVEVTNQFGCKAIDKISVNLPKSKLAVANVFTPNELEENKQFYPVFKGVVTDFEMYIYSRWGEQLFQLKKSMVVNNELKGEGWDGTYKGKKAASGVYVWIIFYDGQKRYGTITLLR